MCSPCGHCSTAYGYRVVTVWSLYVQYAVIMRSHMCTVIVWSLHGQSRRRTLSASDALSVSSPHSCWSRFMTLAISSFTHMNSACGPNSNMTARLTSRDGQWCDRFILRPRGFKLRDSETTRLRPRNYYCHFQISVFMRPCGCDAVWWVI